MRSATGLTLLALLTTGSGPVRVPEDLVREGNAAVQRGDLDRAAQCYADAATRTTDPGLVAFNQGVIALQRGRYRDAELHFLAALDDRDAPAERRATAHYNLGLALLLRGGSAAIYRAAVRANERCLEATPNAGTLTSDAGHNLEVAKLLWREARDREREATPPPPVEPPPESVPQSPPEAPPDAGTTPKSEPGAAAREAGAKTARSTAPPRTTTQTTPGRGTLPVLPDNEQFPPLSPEDARALLQRHAARLAKDRAASAELLAGPERPDRRDW